MSVDARLLVSAAQALTATAVATDTIPLEVAGLDLGAGEPLGFAFHVNVAADATTGDETYEFQIVTSTASDGTTGQDVISSEAIARATLAAGYRFLLPVPVSRIAATATHITAKYVLGGTTPTITCTAYLTPLKSFDERNLTIRSGFTVAA
jgi:hypothetical protein